MYGDHSIFKMVAQDECLWYNLIVSEKVEFTAPDEVAFNVDQFSGGLLAVLESILIVSPEPVSAEKLAHTLAVSKSKVVAALKTLQKQYIADTRGFELLEFDGAWRYYSAAEYSDVVQKFIVGNAESKLSVAALETLAIIAYKQPISRLEIAQIRGVNVDGVVRTLLARGLVDVAAKKKGEDVLASKYVTTALFLERLGVTSLAELEPLAPFLPDDIDQVPEFEDIRKRSKVAENDEFSEDGQDD